LHLRLHSSGGLGAGCFFHSAIFDILTIFQKTKSTDILPSHKNYKATTERHANKYLLQNILKPRLLLLLLAPALFFFFRKSPALCFLSRIMLVVML
jgi:hypothetical protein